MRLGHLNLTVGDVGRATEFYARWFGFDRVLADYPDGTRFVTDDAGFELALHEGEPSSAAETWHFGFLASDAPSVRRLQAAMAEQALPITEATDVESYVGFKCSDPDGHTIEVYFEPR